MNQIVNYETCTYNKLYSIPRVYERGEGSAGTSVRDPETQEGARESLKSPKALAIDV
jgi:hypothetical protein